MELLNESPPTGVLNSMNQAVNSTLNSSLNSTLNSSSGALNNATTNLSSTAVSNSASSQQSAAVFGSNSGALSLANSDQLNLRCSTNNLSGAFSSSSLCLALGSTKFQSNSSSSNSLKTDFVHCSPTIPDSQQQRNNFLNCENSSTQSAKFDKYDSAKHCLTGSDLSSIGSLVHGTLLQPTSSSLSSPVSTTNSLKSTSSSFSSSSTNSLCFSNNHSVNNPNNLNNLNNNLNLANLNSLSNNLQAQQLPSNSGLFCAQQLFNAANSQQKVKRTRQRVDAGEPRNSYASIANYATSRLGKAPRNFPNATGLPGTKGLFDQLGYLGLNALLTGNSFSPDDFLLPNSFAGPANLVNHNNSNSNLVNSAQNPISSLLASLATSEKSANSSNSSPFNGPPLEAPEQANGKLSSQQQQMLLSQSFHWNTNQPPQFGRSDSPVTASVNQPPLENQQQRPASDLSASLLGTASAANLIEPLIDNMAKSRFSEDAVTLEYAKGECRHFDFAFFFHKLY